MSDIHFVSYIHKHDEPHSAEKRKEERRAQKQIVRAQASRASSQARLETICKSHQGRNHQPGQQVFSVRLTKKPRRKTAPLPHSAVEQHQQQVTIHPDRDVSVTLHSHKLLGGSVPVGHAEMAILDRFVQRFAEGPSNERPWIELILAENASSSTPRARSLVTTALQANATALFANDVQQPEARAYAAKLYMSTIKNLQMALGSRKWRDSEVMYTCMILTLYECIESDNPTARSAHIRAVAQLIQQKGVLSFVNGLEHRTFRYYRINILMVCLAERRHCFLAEDEWRTIPFSGDTPPKTLSDLLTDILVEIPGLLATAETLKNGDGSPYALIKKAFELAYFVRRLILDLETWKENHIWTYPSLRTTSNIKGMDLHSLCEAGIGQVPYDSSLAEALNCYLAAHLILAMIAQRFAERSFIMRSVLPQPYQIHELIAAIVLVSEKHMDASGLGLMNMGFPLKVAEGAAAVHEPGFCNVVQILLRRVNELVARKYNIKFSASSQGGNEKW